VGLAAQGIPSCRSAKARKPSVAEKKKESKEAPELEVVGSELLKNVRYSNNLKIL